MALCHVNNVPQCSRPALDLSAIRGIRDCDVDDFEALINDARRERDRQACRNCVGPPHLHDGGEMSERTTINNPRGRRNRCSAAAAAAAATAVAAASPVPLPIATVQSRDNEWPFSRFSMAHC
ncbi:hypothetical protein ALC57_16999 [Trachymyrmex cornetzi]|uniref:Uncharacterized protein n=1 Tax=Trachymyrmex cornetzi TaxID=471704 RepID=A0A195DEE7_9HYME|nr:hypothetical protein ALC57_16999 [Trachymyrmex cornetzi]